MIQARTDACTSSGRRLLGVFVTFLHGLACVPPDTGVRTGDPLAYYSMASLFA